jgi:hypothetical protein
MSKLCRDGRDFSFVDYLTTEKFLKLSYDVMFLGFPNDALFFDSGNNKLNEMLYASKSSVINIISTLVTIVKPHLHIDKLKDTGFIRLLSTCITEFLNQLMELGGNPENESLLEEIKMRDCATSLLKLCAQLVYIKEFHEVYKNIGYRLLTDIGFPFLRTMSEEKLEMTDNPAEFVKLALDVCDRQKFLHLKSQAAKFIETVGDKIKGIFPSLCHLTLDILEYAVIKDPNMDLYPTLKEHYQDSKFFKYCSDEDLIDVSILTLTMVSYALPKDATLKSRFISIVEKVTKPILDRNSLLLNCRLTIMLGYYIDILYKNDESVFFQVINMFINSLTSGEDALALAHQSADTLNTIINDNDIIPRVRPMINELLKDVAGCIMSVRIPDFFDFLSEIFKFYKDDINEESLILTIKCLVQRIEKDVTDAKGEARAENPFQVEQVQREKSESSTFTTSMSVQKCWSIIISILETDTYIEKYLPQMEEELKYLFGLLCDPSRIEFDDEIVKAMKIIITKSGRISETMRILFPYLKKSHEKHKFIYSELFDVIKAYCKVDKDFIFSTPDHLQNIFGYGVQTLFNGDHTANGAVYLIQLFLLLKSDNHHLTEAIIPEVLSRVFDRLKEKPMNRILKRCLFGIVLASIVSNYRATFQYLESTSSTPTVLQTLLKFSPKSMDNALERKLFAMSLTSLLTQEELPDSVREKSPQIISKITEILVKTTLDEAKKARKKEKKKLEYKEDDDFDSDLDSEDESDEEGESDEEREQVVGMGEEFKDMEEHEGDSTDEQEGDDILEAEIDVQSNFSIMKTGFNQFDEFKYFKHVIGQLYKKHAVEMEQLVSQMSEG